MKTLILISLTIPLLFACGKKDGNSPAAAAKPAAPATGSVSTPQVEQVKAAHLKKINSVHETDPNGGSQLGSSLTVGPTTAVEAPPAAPAAAPSNAPVEVVQTPAAPKVIAIGSTSQPANEFLNRGYSSAMNNAISCSVTGAFNGSECYLVFSDGKTSRVNPDNRNLISDYVSELQTQSNEMKAKEQSEKLAKKQAKLKNQLAEVEKQIAAQQ